jgi:hypothetical protein
MYAPEEEKNPETLFIRDVLRSFEEINSFCSTSDARHVTLVTNPVISHE